MKKAAMLIISTVCCFVLCSCGSNESGKNDPRSIDFDGYSFAKETMSEVLRCFDEEDTEALKSLFSEELASTSNIDKQIEDAMEYYEGKSISHDELHQSIKSSSFRKDHYKYKCIDVYMYNIITEKNKIYDLGFWYILVDDDAPSQIGLYKLFFLNEKGVPILIIDPNGGRNIIKEETVTE